MNQFAFAGANVTDPSGTVYVDVPAIMRGNFLVFNVDGIERRVEMASGWAHGQKGYGFMDMDGKEWNVKRTQSGCGSC